MNRRRFLIQGMLGSAVCFLPFSTYGMRFPQNTDSYFKEGIASGDPTQEAVVIWTRITDKYSSNLEVAWEVSDVSDFSHTISKGTTTTSGEKDCTVKIDVKGLQAATHYYYRFMYKDKHSATGSCKTLPHALQKTLNAAIVSCNNYEDGYFTSFEHIVRQTDIDYVVHLGDYIYEYETLGYANKNFVERSKRTNEPLHELVTLDDYRKRFRLYRSDVHLQKLHEKKAFFCMWDDHELANNAYVDGAKNHQPEEGAWNTRKKAALQAYFEWMPVRAANVQEMVRKVTIGTDCQLYFLEERLEGRDKQYAMQNEKINSKDRKLISDHQFTWLANHLQNDSIRWHVLFNQVMFTGYRLPKNSTSEIDWWTGYPQQRQQLIKIFEKMKNPPLIVTGDHHQAHVLELKSNRELPVAWEFLTPSITSKNDDRLTASEIKSKKASLYENNPHLVYSNTHSHGYVILQISKEKIGFDYRYNSDILNPDGKEVQGPVFELTANNQFTKHV